MDLIVDRTTPPAIFPLAGMTLPGVVREKLANGVQLVVLRHGQQPVNRITVAWPAGLADVGSPEALRLLRVMLLEGTSQHSGAEIADMFEFNGAWIKVEVGNHLTSVTLHSLNSTANEVLPLLGEILTAPSFSSDAFDSICQKEAAACELRRRKVVQQAAELSSQMVYGIGHPLAHVITPDALRAVPVEAVRRMYADLMRSTPPTIYLAGDVDAGLVELVKSMALQLELRMTDSSVSRKIIAVPPAKSGTEVRVDGSSMQTAIRLAIPAIGRTHPDYEALRYTVFALGGYFGSRLMSNIREDKGYTYGINASLASMPETAHVTIACQTDNRYASAVIEETEREIARLATETMDNAEFEVIQSSIMSGLAALLDSPFSIMDYHQILDTFGLPDGYYAYQLEQLAALTPERIRDCAAKYLTDAPRVIAMAGNPA